MYMYMYKLQGLIFVQFWCLLCYMYMTLEQRIAPGNQQASWSQW